MLFFAVIRYACNCNKSFFRSDAEFEISLHVFVSTSRGATLLEHLMCLHCVFPCCSTSIAWCQVQCVASGLPQNFCHVRIAVVMCIAVVMDVVLSFSCCISSSCSSRFALRRCLQEPNNSAALKELRNVKAENDRCLMAMPSSLSLLPNSNARHEEYGWDNHSCSLAGCEMSVVSMFVFFCHGAIHQPRMLDL